MAAARAVWRAPSHAPALRRAPAPQRPARWGRQHVARADRGARGSATAATRPLPPPPPPPPPEGEDGTRVVVSARLIDLPLAAHAMKDYLERLELVDDILGELLHVSELAKEAAGTPEGSSAAEGGSAGAGRGGRGGDGTPVEVDGTSEAGAAAIDSSSEAGAAAVRLVLKAAVLMGLPQVEEAFEQRREFELSWSQLAEAHAAMGDADRLQAVQDALCLLAIAEDQQTAAEQAGGALPRHAVPPGRATAEALSYAAAQWASQADEMDNWDLMFLLEEALADSDDPRTELWEQVAKGAALTGAATLTAMAAAGSPADLAVLLQPPLAATPAGGWQALATSWAAWTAPYVALTAAAHAAAPDLAGVNRVVLRQMPYDQRTLLQRVSALECAAAVLVAAGCQCLVWQVLWLEAVLAALGGSRDALLLSQPAELEAQLGSALGTLVGAPRVPAGLAAPAAVVAAGLLEGAWWWAATAFRYTNFIFGLPSLGLQRVQPKPYETAACLDTAQMAAMAIRTALAGAYLCAEAALTGGPWLPAATSAAGLLTGAALARSSRGRSSGGAAR